MTSAGTIVQVEGTRDTKLPEGNDFSRNYSSSGENKRHKGAGEEMILAGTIVQVARTRDTKVPERK
jgi:hypothetical protein